MPLDSEGSPSTRPRVSGIRRAAGAAPPHHFRVFLSSPSDVAEERQAAVDILRNLPRDPLLRDIVTINDVSWDDRDAPPVSMDARLTLQSTVERGIPPLSACDLTIVILWGRIGTPLSEARRPDGSQYESGTVHEFEDARDADRPTFVYRRLPPPMIDVEDPDAPQKSRQRHLVDKFFEQFKNPGGSRRAGVNSYGTIDEFKSLFEKRRGACGRSLHGLPKPGMSVARRSAPSPGRVQQQREECARRVSQQEQPRQPKQEPRVSRGGVHVLPGPITSVGFVSFFLLARRPFRFGRPQRVAVRIGEPRDARAAWGRPDNEIVLRHPLVPPEHDAALREITHGFGDAGTIQPRTV